jgi:zinc transport system permease protein
MLSFLNNVVVSIKQVTSMELYEVRAMLALVTVAIACGALGSLVVGQRMAFFSDAMAHTAMAGVTLSMLFIVLAFQVRSRTDAEQYFWMLPLAMAGVGVVVGLVMAFLQQRTNLTSDTVIGVFFALSLGFAGLMMPGLQQRVRIDLDTILFGQLLFMDDLRLVILIGMTILTLAMLLWRYNGLVFGSLHGTLASSRGITTQLNHYLFVVVLAIVVNLSIYAVGVLLINALLVVPAAAAANMSSNLRRMFWITLLGCVACALVGYRAAMTTQITLGNLVIDPGPSGAVVMTCVGWFVVSLFIRAIRKRFFGIETKRPTGEVGHVHHAGCVH